MNTKPTLLTLALLLAACGTPSTPSDSGSDAPSSSDSASPDASSPDASSPDASSPDAIAPDAVAPDAPPPDATAPEASVDASSADASADTSRDAPADAAPDGPIDNDRDGYPAGTDCDDNNAAVHPGATELCDGVDNNCNGAVDEGVRSAFYRDGDSDTYGGTATMMACAAPSGYVARGGDCNDANPAVHPGATEVCDGVDEDCDGTLDFGYTVPGTHATPQLAIDAAGSTPAHLCLLNGTHDAFFVSGVAHVIEGQSRDGVILRRSAASSSPVVSLYNFNGSLRNVTLSNNQSPLLRIYGAGSATVSGLTMSNNTLTLTGECGGLVSVEGGINTAWTDVLLVGNAVSCVNGPLTSGLFSLSGNTTMNRVSVLNNTTRSNGTYRGALFQYQSTFTATNLLVANNGYTGSGTSLANSLGVQAENPTAVSIINSAFVANTVSPASTEVSRVALDTPSAATFVNNVVAYNTAAGTVHLLVAFGASSTLTNNDFFGNSALSEGVTNYSVDPTGTSGNIAVNPAFVSRTGTDATSWNLHLAAGSPLLNAGAATLLDRDGSRSDIGLYGGPNAAP